MNLLRRFHEDDSAQISFLGVAGAVCFIALLSMIINTNDVISERVHMQDVADATVLSAASWNARGLNTISFVNVLNTKLASAAVLINAWADAIPVIRAVGEIQRAIFQACSGVPFIGAFCAAMAVVVNIQLKALEVMNNLVDKKLARPLSRCNQGSKLLWKLMAGLEKLADGVQKAFGLIAIAESISIAKANGADFGIVVNGMLADGNVKEALFLPVKKADEGFAAHCPYMKNGGPGFELQNYECKQGPQRLGKERIDKTFLLPFINLVAHPIFAGMVTKHMVQLGCKPAPGEEDTKIPVDLEDLNQCSKYDEYGRWSHRWSQTVELSASEANQYSLRDFIPWRPRSGTGASDKEALDKDEIGGQLEDLGLPTDGGAAGAAEEVPLGRGNALINEERQPRIRFIDQVRCRNPRYPYYVPPSDWDDPVPGQVVTNPNCFGCKTIKQFSEFTWVSGGTHVIGGPETSGGYFIRVNKREIAPKEEGADPTYRFIIETVTLYSAGTKEMTQEEFKKYLEEDKKKNVNTDGSDSSTGCDKPEPFVLDKGSSQADIEKFQNKLRFIGVVWLETDKDPPFWSNFFEDPPPTMIAYAQGQVYNYLSEDTFTQDWRVRLEQATLLESLVSSGKAGAMNNQGLVPGIIGAVNNH